MSGPLFLRINDSHDYDCALAPARVCVFEVEHGENPGDTRIDVRQSYSRVGLGVDPAAVPGDTPPGILPQYALALEGDSMFLDWSDPYGILVAMYGSVPQERPQRDALGFDLNGDRIGLYYFGPSLKARDEPDANRTVGMEMDDRDGGVSAYRIGPFNENGTFTSSDWLIDVGSAPCALDECSAVLNSTIEAGNARTPEVSAGLEWETVEVASDANLLGGSVGAREATGAPVLGPREIPTAPALRYEAPLPSPMLAYAPVKAGVDPTRQGGGAAAAPTGRAEPDVPDEKRVRAGLVNIVVATAVATGVVVAILLTLYSRFSSRQSLLNHPSRCAIIAKLQEVEMASATELRRSLGLGRNTFAHHVSFLQRAGVVETVTFNGHAFVRRRISADTDTALREAELMHPTRGPILALLLRQEGNVVSRAAVHRELEQIPQRTRNHSIRKLIELGLVREEVQGSEPMLALVPKPSQQKRAALAATLT